MESGIIEFNIIIQPDSNCSICILPKLLTDSTVLPTQENLYDSATSILTPTQENGCNPPEEYKFCTIFKENIQECTDELNSMRYFLDFYFRKNSSQENSRSILLDYFDQINTLKDEPGKNLLASTGCEELFDIIRKDILEFNTSSDDTNNKAEELIYLIEGFDDTIKEIIQTHKADLDNRYDTIKKYDEVNLKDITKKIKALTDFKVDSPSAYPTTLNDIDVLIKTIDILLPKGEPYKTKINKVLANTDLLIANREKLFLEFNKNKSNIETLKNSHERFLNERRIAVKDEILRLKTVKTNLMSKQQQERALEENAKRDAEKIAAEDAEKLKKEQEAAELLRKEIEDKKVREAKIIEEKKSELEKTPLRFNFTYDKFFKIFHSIVTRYSENDVKYKNDLEKINKLFRNVIKFIKGNLEKKKAINLLSSKEDNKFNFDNKIIDIVETKVTGGVSGENNYNIKIILGDGDKEKYPFELNDSRNNVRFMKGDFVIYKATETSYLFGIIINEPEKDDDIVIVTSKQTPSSESFFLKDGNILDYLLSIPSASSMEKITYQQIYLMNLSMFYGKDLPDYILADKGITKNSPID